MRLLLALLAAVAHADGVVVQLNDSTTVGPVLQCGDFGARGFACECAVAYRCARRAGTRAPLPTAAARAAASVSIADRRRRADRVSGARTTARQATGGTRTRSSRTSGSVRRRISARRFASPTVRLGLRTLRGAASTAQRVSAAPLTSDPLPVQPSARASRPCLCSGTHRGAPFLPQGTACITPQGIRRRLAGTTTRPRRPA